MQCLMKTCWCELTCIYYAVILMKWIFTQNLIKYARRNELLHSVRSNEILWNIPFAYTWMSICLINHITNVNDNQIWIFWKISHILVTFTSELTPVWFWHVRFPTNINWCRCKVWMNSVKNKRRHSQLSSGNNVRTRHMHFFCNE